MADTIPELSVVVPLYNEEENIPELYRRLSSALGKLGVDYQLVFVNDGSRDRTPTLLAELHAADRRVAVVHLSRNFGHQAAVSAGLAHAQGQAVVVMDGDLQDPPEVLGAFLDKWREGFDVVYAVRQNRKEGILKRAGYWLFYRLLRAISDLDIPLDSGDFCLMDHKVVEVLNHLPERMRFVRGLRTFVGFRQSGLCYDRAARNAGRPKYSFRALLQLAADGLFSFSSYPLRLATYCGCASIALSIALAIWALADALVSHTAPRGWASTLIVVLFMGAIQLLSLGVIGEYLRRIFIEAKQRPPFIVERFQDHPRGEEEPSLVRPATHSRSSMR
jgi:dolichol-phosphate mannosyltransferase